MERFFFDAQNNFQWGSIATIISFIGIIVTYATGRYTTKKSIEAQVKSSTKVDWINKIIDIASDLIANYVTLNKVSRDITVLTIKIEELGNFPNVELKKQLQKNSILFNEAVQSSSYHTNQLKMYLINISNTKDVYSALNALDRAQINLANCINSTNKNTEDILDMLTNEVNKLTKQTKDFQTSLGKCLKDEWNQIIQ